MISPDQVSIGMSVGTQPPLRQIRAATVLARLAGFDVAWTIDHFQGFFPTSLWDRDFSEFASPDSSPHAFYDYQTLLGYLAGRAGRLHLAVGVTEPVRRHPVLLAQMAMTVSAMTKQPMILGVGAGEAENITPYGLDFETPVSRLEEALQVLRLALDSNGPFDFEGVYFRMNNALMDLAPRPGRRPLVWLAAHGPRMLRLTGEYGDGWYPTLPYTPSEYESALRVVREAAAGAGRNPDAIVPSWQAFALIGRDQREISEMAASPLARYMALLAPATMWSRFGLDHPFGTNFRGFIDILPEEHTRAELLAAMDRVPPNLVEQAVLSGTPDEVHRKLREMIDAGLRHVVLQPVSALISKRSALFSLRSSIGISRRLKREGV